MELRRAAAHRGRLLRALLGAVRAARPREDDVRLERQVGRRRSGRQIDQPWM